MKGKTMKKNYAPYKSVDGRVYNKEFDYATSRKATPRQVAKVKKTITFSTNEFRRMLAFLENDINTFLNEKPVEPEEKNLWGEKYTPIRYTKNNEMEFMKTELWEKLCKEYPEAQNYSGIVDLKKKVIEERDIYLTLDVDAAVGHDRFNTYVEEHIKKVEDIFLWEKLPIPKKNAKNLKKFFLITSYSTYKERESKPYQYYLVQYENGLYKKATSKKELLQITNGPNKWGFDMDAKYAEKINHASPERYRISKPEYLELVAKQTAEIELD